MTSEGSPRVGWDSFPTTHSPLAEPPARLSHVHVSSLTRPWAPRDQAGSSKYVASSLAPHRV